MEGEVDRGQTLENLTGQDKEWGFTLSAIGNHWDVSKREITQLNEYFKNMSNLLSSS